MCQTKVRNLEIFENVQHNYNPYERGEGRTVEEEVSL
jgi:hypothetical protein